jgi:transcription initiation factor IIE alpha subunit
MKEIADRFNCTPSDISKIIDHLHEEGIIVCNRHLSWSINEIDRIKALYNNGVPLCDIALSVNRSKDAVKTKLLHIRKVENVLKKNKERGKQ